MSSTTDANPQASTPSAASQPDDSEPSAERQAELRAVYEANLKVSKPPYAGIDLHSRGELSWIMRERGWKSTAVESIDQAIDLRSVSFFDANLNGANFAFSNLSGAFITGDEAKFRGADFTLANLSGAFITGDRVDFSGANFGNASLHGALILGDALNFNRANFAAADLSGSFIEGDDANFSGADLNSANLGGARIVSHRADFSNTIFVLTNLAGASLAGDHINFNGADFNSANLSGALINGGAANFSNAKFVLANLSDSFIDGPNANFSGANFNSANLRGAHINGDRADFSQTDFTLTNLAGATLSGDHTNFSGAIFRTSNLSGALINGDAANFSGANFIMANLSDANIDNDQINWRDAEFFAANLGGASIVGDFSNVDFTQARMDAKTSLGDNTGNAAIKLGPETKLADVAWNGAILANIDWDKISRLGDEAAIKAAKTRQGRIDALRATARAYRGLAKALQSQGLTIPALKYRTREQQLERRVLRNTFQIGPWLFSWLLNIVSGYGDKPGRALACYVAVVSACTATFWALTNQVFGFVASASSHLKWYEALVLSISSFHGRGFFPSTLSLGDPIALVAAAEAIVGLFIELVFIATFTQRFFAR